MPRTAACTDPPQCVTWDVTDARELLGILPESVFSDNYQVILHSRSKGRVHATDHMHIRRFASHVSLVRTRAVLISQCIERDL
eukprot:963330-Amphidinium_carterae.2